MIFVEDFSECSVGFNSNVDEEKTKIKNSFRIKSNVGWLDYVSSSRRWGWIGFRDPISVVFVLLKTL